MKDDEIKEVFGRTMKARSAIVEKIGPFVKGVGRIGKIDCPICSSVEALDYHRSGWNGHIHASCKTDGCVRWME